LKGGIVSGERGEMFFLRTVGGPHPGDRYCTEGAVFGEGAVGFVVAWPLPEELPDMGGVYRKVSESQLPPMPEGSHVMRGAEYHWHREGEGS
jgi:hypothetical protein